MGKIKWTYDKCKEEALKYNSRWEFQKKSQGVYQAAQRNKWLEEICFHMIEMKKPNGYWTKERCAEEALKYMSKEDFIKNNISAYNYSVRNKWLEEICFHMIEMKKPNGYWTKERCAEEALKFNTRTVFSKKCGIAYNNAIKHKWLDEICSHMKLLKKEEGYWTKKRCAEEALKYDNKRDYHKNSGGSYSRALDEKWLDEICSHMKILGNLYNRCIYAYEFSDNSVYIGLTYNIQNRNKRHIKENNSPVYRHIKETNLQPKLSQLTDYIDKDLASIKEGEFVNIYKTNGWNILNKAKAGVLGGNYIKWTYEKCKKEALKYVSKTNFRKQSGGAYVSSLNNNWLNDICSHMKELKKPKNYWTKEHCQEEALKYKTITEFQKKSGGAYTSSLNNNWSKEICSHMIEIKKPSNYWTKEKCAEEALKYNNITEFGKKHSQAYKKIKKFGWYNEICSHMIELQKPKGYWNNKEQCHEEALKYNTIREFQRKSSGAYHTALKNKWVAEICSHMNKNNKI